MISANDTKPSSPMKTEKIEYKSEEKTFLISLSYNKDELIFYLKNTLPFHYDQFESKFNFTELKNINQFFAQFSNMESIGSLYSKLLKNQKIKISENKDEISLSFTNITEDMIILSVKKKEYRGDEKYDKLYEIVKSLINDVKELKDENLKMKEELNELNKFKRETEEKRKKKIIEQKYHNLKDSSILIDKDKIKMISDWIKPNTNIIYNQIYKATRDGGTGQIFHSHCDNKGPTLTLIESKNNHIFGGYITISWEAPKSWTYKDGDNNAFIFSINNRKKYPIQDKSKVIYNHCDYGPDFGSIDIYLINSNFLENSNSCTSASYKAPPNEIAGGEKFDVKELEVYTVQFE